MGNQHFLSFLVPLLLLCSITSAYMSVIDIKQGNIQPTIPPGGQQGPPQVPHQGQQGAPWQPTKPPGQQGPPQGAPGQIQPTKPPGHPNADNNANNIYLHETLVAILVLSSLSVASIILIGLYYCFVDSRQNATHHCTK